MIKKKKSPKEIIERSKPFGVEHAYIKNFGKEVVEVSDNPQSDSVGGDYEKINEYLKRTGIKRYSHIHTHPINDKWRYFISPENEARAMIYPSGADLLEFMRDDKKKVEVIATRGTSSGKIYGYMILRKTKNTPTIDIDHQETFDPIMKYGQETYHHKSIGDRQKSLKKLSTAYHLQFRTIGLRKRNPSGLENSLTTATAIISGAAFLFSFLFISSSLTGRTISNLNQTSSNWIGGILFVVGLIGFFVIFLKNKNLNEKTHG